MFVDVKPAKCKYFLLFDSAEIGVFSAADDVECHAFL
jgi:hypothetical protein